MKIFNSDRELFLYVRNYDLETIQPKINSFNNYQVDKINIEEILTNIYRDDSILLIDARSEKEHKESSIPNSYNFPILKNEERHNVGLVYRKYSAIAAFQLAVEYANEKYEYLKNFLKNNLAHQRKIYIYCWRGGGRSKYLAKMINELSYECKTIIGGFKSYRNIVNNFFSNKSSESELNKINLIELSGMTGVGKTLILNYLKNYIPVIDLEEAAHHYSSLFGSIPYLIRNFEPIKSQASFENNIYSQILKGLQSKYYKGFFVIESESKKVGDFFIPDALYKKIESAPTIQIESSIEKRVDRIIADYFGDNLSGLPHLKNVLIEKEKFFKRELSNKIYQQLLDFLESGNAKGFTETLLTKYYDRKYKIKPKKPALILNSDNLNECIQSILNYIEIVGK